MRVDKNLEDEMLCQMFSIFWHCQDWLDPPTPNLLGILRDLTIKVCKCDSQHLLT